MKCVRVKNLSKQKTFEALVSQQYNTVSMNTLVSVIFALLLGIVAVTASSGHSNDAHYGHENGFQRVYNGIEAAYNNAERQHGLNKYAEEIGAGTGTAKLYGVPGTGHYFGYGHKRIYDSRGDKDNYGYSSH